MNIERRSEIDPRLIQLREIFDQRGVKAAVIDLDNTLVNTYWHYLWLMTAYSQAIAAHSSTNCTGDEVLSNMRTFLKGLRPVYKVDPTLMKETARLTALRFKVDYYHPAVQENVDELMELYRGIDVDVFDEADLALDVIRGSGVDLYCFTHRGEDTAELILRQTRLRYYFKSVYCVDTLKDKDADALKGVLVDIGLEPKQAVVIGDSWTADVGPAVEIGVPKDQIFRVKTVYGEASEGGIEGIKRVNRFADVVDALCQMEV